MGHTGVQCTRAGAANKQSGPCCPGPRQRVEDRDVLTADKGVSAARARVAPSAGMTRLGWLVSGPDVVNSSRAMGGRPGTAGRLRPGGHPRAGRHGRGRGKRSWHPTRPAVTVQHWLLIPLPKLTDSRHSLDDGAGEAGRGSRPTRTLSYVCALEYLCSRARPARRASHSHRDGWGAPAAGLAAMVEGGVI